MVDPVPVHASIGVSAAVAAPMSHVFAFLADPANHHRLTSRRLRLLEVGDGAQLSGGSMLIRGPLLIRRRADTQVSELRAPDLITGEARLGTRTVAVVRWELGHHSADCTHVALTADPRSLSRSDRLLLRCGGARWIRAMLAETLERLAGQLGPPKAAAPA